jgi:hypothetical protein
VVVIYILNTDGKFFQFFVSSVKYVGGGAY